MVCVRVLTAPRVALWKLARVTRTVSSSSSRLSSVRVTTIDCVVSPASMTMEPLGRVKSTPPPTALPPTV